MLVLDAESASDQSAADWSGLQGWLEAAADRLLLPVRTSAFFGFGERILRVDSDEPELVESVDRAYQDCKLTDRSLSAESPQIHCQVWRVTQSPLVALKFLTGAPENPAGIALAFLHPPRNEPPYSITPATRSGWNLAGARGKPVLAASDNIVLFDTTRVLADFLPDFLVSVALAAQPDLLVVHAASVRIGNSGALLSGRSHAGKTTTSLHLAARGHSLLGDELAAIRLSTGELEHLRRSVRLRPGPRGKSLLSRLLEVGAFDSSPAHCAGTTQLTIGTLFPAPLPRPAKLRAAFFLQGFSEHPALEEIQPTLSDSSIFDALAANDIALVSWGLVPWKRALRLLALKRLLSRTRCWKLSVGKPEDTARLIEQTMEAL